MKKSLAALLIFFFSLVQVSAQAPATKELKFPQHVFIAFGNSSTVEANELLQILGEGSGKSMSAVSFYIDFDLFVTVNTTSTERIFDIRTSKIRLNGDFKYKGFDVSDHIEPYKIMFSLRESYQGKTLRDFGQHMRLNSYTFENIHFNYKDTLVQPYVYSIENVSFFFTNAKQNLSEIVTSINLYYQLADQLSNTFLELKQLRIQDEERYKDNLRKLNETHQLIQTLEKKNPENVLPLQVIDPAHYRDKLFNLRNLLISKDQEMEAVMRTLHLYFYNKGMGALHVGNYGLAAASFSKSLEVNPAFAPAYFQLALLDFKNGDLHEATCKGHELLTDFNVDPRTTADVRQLLHDVAVAYIGRSETELKRRNFEAAIHHLNEADMVCKQNPGIVCPEDLQQAYIITHQAAYADQLSGVKSALQKEQFTLAEERVRKAIRYQQDHAEYLPSGGDAQGLLIVILQEKHDHAIALGQSLTGRQLYTDALAQYSIADSLQREYKLKPATDFRKLQTSAARPATLQYLDLCDAAIAKNNLEEARKNLRAAEDLQFQYSLQKDGGITNRLSASRKSIFSQQCVNAERKISAFYYKALDLETQKDFASADAVLTQALTIKAENPDCGLRTDSIEQEQLRIRPATTFQQLLESAKQAESEGHFDAAMATYQSATTQFNDRQVGAFGLTHDPDVFNYIQSAGSNSYLRYAVDVLIRKEQLDRALDFCKLLSSRHVDHQLYDGSLYQLGMLMGKRDYATLPVGKAKVKAREYTAGDKALRRFEKGYRKGFRR